MANVIDLTTTRVRELRAERRRLTAEQERLAKQVEKIDRHLSALAHSSGAQNASPASDETFKVPLRFYARVRIRGATGPAAALNDTFGVILGRAESAPGRWEYAVGMEADQKCWDLPGDLLVPTGDVLSREQFYTGSSVRVSVDTSGRGTVKKSAASRRRP